jgi:predicted transcriptional regulator
MQHISSSLKINWILCFLAIAFIVFSLSLSVTCSSLETTVTTSDVSLVQVSENQAIAASNVPYTTIIMKPALKRYTILLNGTTTTIVELPSESRVVQLPNNRLGISYSETEKSVLPSGSVIHSYNSEILVTIPDESNKIKTTNFVSLSVESITTSASYSQTIPKLDHYKLTITLPSFSTPILNELVMNYSVVWGDGLTQSYTKNDTSIVHTYKKSGTYDLSFLVSDEFGFTYNLKKQYPVKYEGDIVHTYLVIDANKEPIAVTTSSSLGLLTLGLIVLTETGKYKFLAMFILFIPLYTRLQKEDVLDQFVRGQIYGYIKTNPGVHYNQIRRKVDVKNGTLSYHLWVLEKTDLIKSRREGLRYRAFYPTGMKFPQAERFRLTELQIKIIDCIKNKPGIHQKEIAEKLNEKPQTINYNIKILAQAELISVIKKGRTTRCYVKSSGTDLSQQNQSLT